MTARWKASLDNEPHTAIMEAKPDSARVLIDMNNGCYRSWFTGQRIRPFSWTLRGHELGVRMALRQMWIWEYLSSGKLPPAHLDLRAARHSPRARNADATGEWHSERREPW